MSRADAIAYMRIAGYHDDMRSFVRLYTENLVSRAVADAAYQAGKQAKKNGMRCTCIDCANAPPKESHEQSK